MIKPFFTLQRHHPASFYVSLIPVAAAFRLSALSFESSANEEARRRRAIKQVPFAEKAAALKAAKATALKAACSQKTCEPDDSDDDDPPQLRLISKSKVLKIVGCSYPTLWAWMRSGTFPRSRVVGGRSMWRSDEIDAWLAGLPIRRLKGDAAAELNEAAEARP
jgi:predicted DNA-binding transcriptional regulator AlpA